ncbi:MAG: hypothetical protein U0U67_04525 [Chitinophagales bacterium]
MQVLWKILLKNKEQNFLKFDRFLLLGIVLLIVCGIKITWNLQNYMDVLFWDESLYLHRGTCMFDFIPHDWGPSYSLWYKIVSLFIHDKLYLYYFNFKLTTILISIALFLLLLSCGVQRILSFILALFFLSSFINLPVWPRISHFCIIVIITGILIAKYSKTTFLKFSVMSFAFMICSYARPELFLPFLACFVLTIILFLVKIKKITKIEIGTFATLVACFIFMFIFFKTPLNNGDSQRSLRVFLQHFAWNDAVWKNAQTPFWLEFNETNKQYFPDVSSLSAIIHSNSKMFFQHIFFNLKHYILLTGKTTVSFFFPVFTKDFHWLCLMVGSMFLIIYLSFGATAKHFTKRFLILIKANLFTFFMLSLVVAPTVFICIYAYPRHHYVLLQVPFLMLLAAVALSSFNIEIDQPMHKIIVLSFVWIYVTPAAEDFRYYNLFRQEDSTCNATTIKYIRKHFPSNKRTTIFDAEGSMTNLMPPNFVNYNQEYVYEKDAVLSDFINTKQIDIIYVTPTLLALKKVKNDTVFSDLLNQPEKYGFFKQKTGNFVPYLLIKDTHK